MEVSISKKHLVGFEILQSRTVSNITREHDQGNIYFAGARLASSLAWALASAKRTVRQLTAKYKIENVDYI